MLRNTTSFVSILVLALGLSAGTLAPRVLAQDAGVPNISGTWELIEFNGSKKSWGDPRFPEITLIVRQAGPELKITRKRIRVSRDKTINGTEEVREFTHHTDGREDNNLGRVDLWFDESTRNASVTRLSGNKILTEFKEERLMGSTRGISPRGAYSLSDTLAIFKEEWSLNEAGSRLVMNFSSRSMSSTSITADGGGGPASAGWERLKFVFRKVS